MNHGKDICRQLKQLRRDIADQNGIELEIPECTYEGDCSGTCPRCDYELRYLESELARRQRLGKAAVVAGTVLTMALCNDVMAQTPVQPEKSQTSVTVSKTSTGILKGNIIDQATRKPLMSCNVVMKKDGKIVYGARTDFEGNYMIKNIEPGKYELELSYVGYEKVKSELYIKGTGYTIWNELMTRSGEPVKAVICGHMAPRHNFDFGEPATIIRFSADDLMHFPF